MKLLNQESDPKWGVQVYGGQVYRLRHHVLTMKELKSEFRMERWQKLLSTLNSVEFGGVAPGHLLFAQFNVQLEFGDGKLLLPEVFDVTVTLRELDHDISCLKVVTFKGGRIGFAEIPQYTIADFHDLLPHVKPFPKADGVDSFKPQTWGAL